jgi:glycosyltransferase involved in cell wall biosynthesis
LDRRVWLECKALVAAGYTVSVICPKGPGDPGRELLDGVWLYKYKTPAQANGLAGYANEFVSCWLRTASLSLRIFSTRPFSAIQACNPPDTYALLALLYRPFGVRFVYDQHDLCPEIYLARFERTSKAIFKTLLLLERITYRSAHHVISTNESYRAIAMRRGARTQKDTTVVRSGPDTRRMRPGEPRPELRRGRRHLICYLGIMGPQDGVDIVLRAMEIIVYKFGRTDVHAALLGFGDCLEDLKRLSSELKLDQYVTFTGRADARMIGDYLSTADLGLCPDPLNELNDVSTMNKTMEYMAYQLPVVTFELAETRVSAGDAAAYVPPGEVKTFATVVSELLDQPERRALLGERGRRRAVELLDWSAQAPGYVGVFDLIHQIGASPPYDEPSSQIDLTGDLDRGRRPAVPPTDRHSGRVASRPAASPDPRRGKGVPRPRKDQNRAPSGR